MGRTAGDNHARTQGCIKEGRTHLADTAAGIEDDFIIEINRCVFVALIARTRADCIVKGAILAGCHKGMIEELLGNVDVFIAIAVDAVKMGRIVRQDRIDILQISFFDLGFCTCCDRHSDGSRTALVQFIYDALL